MGHKILFVDDDLNIIKILKKQLSGKYDIYFAENAEAGIDYLKTKGPFAIVVADFKMPGLNGLEFLKQAGKISPSTIKIMLTGNADLDVAIEAINEGNIFRFLTKPCKKNDIEKILNLALKKYEEEIELKKESLTDSLTGLWNRRFFDFQLNKKIISAEKLNQTFCVVFIDLNSFKEINDKYGHETGDKALILTAETLKESVRKNDIISRYGGDEFVILVSHEKKIGAIGLVERLKINIKNKVIENYEQIKISFAAGIANYPDDGKTIKEILNTSDQNMYLDKKIEKGKL